MIHQTTKTIKVLQLTNLPTKHNIQNSYVYSIKLLYKINLTVYLYLFGEGSGKHHCLSITSSWHGILFDDPPDLWFKAHIKHSVRLIQYKVSVEVQIARGVSTYIHTDTQHAHTRIHIVYIPTVVQSYSSSLHHIYQSTRSGYQQVTTSLQIP